MIKNLANFIAPLYQKSAQGQGIIFKDASMLRPEEDTKVYFVLAEFKQFQLIT